MPNEAAKRHLRVVVAGLQVVRTACGLMNPPHSTSDPTKVTCGACRRTLAMADAEITHPRRHKNRRRSGH
jgi:hypothetical protein